MEGGRASGRMVQANLHTSSDGGGDIVTMASTVFPSNKKSTAYIERLCLARLLASSLQMDCFLIITGITRVTREVTPPGAEAYM